MKNLQFFLAFTVGFFLNCYAVSTTENREEGLRQSAISALQEDRLAFADDKRTNYTLQAAIPQENFKDAIIEGWHLSLIHSMSSTSPSHTTSTRTVNSGAPTVSESSSGPLSSEGCVYTIYDKNNSYIGTLLERPDALTGFPEQYKQGLLSGRFVVWRSRVRDGGRPCTYLKREGRNAERRTSYEKSSRNSKILT